MSKTFKQICEEMAIGNGQIAGTDGQEPPVHLPRKRKNFAGSEVFVVGNDEFHKSLQGKTPQHRYDRYVGSDQSGEEIRQYGRTNKKKPIILQHETTGAMIYLRR